MKVQRIIPLLFALACSDEKNASGYLATVAPEAAAAVATTQDYALKVRDYNGVWHCLDEAGHWIEPGMVAHGSPLMTAVKWNTDRGTGNLWGLNARAYYFQRDISKNGSTIGPHWGYTVDVTSNVWEEIGTIVTFRYQDGFNLVDRGGAYRVQVDSVRSSGTSRQTWFTVKTFEYDYGSWPVIFGDVLPATGFLQDLSGNWRLAPRTDTPACLPL